MWFALAVCVCVCRIYKSYPKVIDIAIRVVESVGSYHKHYIYKSHDTRTNIYKFIHVHLYKTQRETQASTTHTLTHNIETTHAK